MGTVTQLMLAHSHTDDIQHAFAVLGFGKGSNTNLDHRCACEEGSEDAEWVSGCSLWSCVVVVGC